MRLISKGLVIASFLLISSMRISVAQTSAKSNVENIELAIAKVRSGKTDRARFEAGEQLARLAGKLGSQQVTEALVSDIASLLDSPDDGDRYWAAMALGNIGVLAKSAAPKMIALLSKADCLNGPITSASGIRYALFKMGIKQPPRPTNCNPISG